MAWNLEGVFAEIGVRNGVPYVSGKGQQRPFLQTEASYGIEQVVGSADGLWSLRSVDSAQGDLDPAGYGFAERIRAAPERMHFMIAYYPVDAGDPPALGFTICVPRAVFPMHYALWQAFIFSAAQTRYGMSFDFVGFRSEGAKSDSPTLAEWVELDITRRRPIFGTDVMIRVWKDPPAGQVLPVSNYRTPTPNLLLFTCIAPWLW